MMLQSIRCCIQAVLALWPRGDNLSVLILVHRRSFKCSLRHQVETAIRDSDCWYLVTSPVFCHFMLLFQPRSQPVQGLLAAVTYLQIELFHFPTLVQALILARFVRSLSMRRGASLPILPEPL